MKLKSLFFYVLFVFAIVSCEDRTPEEVVVPSWLTPRLIELEESGDCFGCTVQRWTYKNEYFYHLYCGFWSCLDCEVYRVNGDHVVWGEDIDHADYDQNKHRPVKIWECGDELEAE
ncbi:hypothetical protein OU798_08050 [Prolixibacteraceae bacterium Z1-6]|uniref:Uncharacterized protein n=1 Tax=Draconibacterium aestuarii TaxID=2998507 RepID=A0A9X3F5S6_9BACT|nr:hypothetical protein [Prolixibacteraceae bacterium Z1-6]